MPHPDNSKPVATPPKTDDDRRSFAVKFTAGVIGASVAIVPIVAGAVTFFDPLVRRYVRGVRRLHRENHYSLVHDSVVLEIVK